MNSREYHKNMFDKMMRQSKTFESSWCIHIMKADEVLRVVKSPNHDSIASVLKNMREKEMGVSDEAMDGKMAPLIRRLADWKAWESDPEFHVVTPADCWAEALGVTMVLTMNTQSEEIMDASTTMLNFRACISCVNLPQCSIQIGSSYRRSRGETGFCLVFGQRFPNMCDRGEILMLS